jgi:hypothetical protein
MLVNLTDVNINININTTRYSREVNSTVVCGVMNRKISAFSFEETNVF